MKAPTNSVIAERARARSNRGAGLCPIAGDTLTGNFPPDPCSWRRDRSLQACFFTTFVLLLALLPVTRANSLAPSVRGIRGKDGAASMERTVATGAVTAVPPFVGNHSETFEEFPVEKFGSAQIPILGGTGTVSGTLVETATSGMFLLCPHAAQPSDGVILLGANAPSSALTISFATPVSAFGAYWASLPPECGSGTSSLAFFDVSGNQIGTDTFFYLPPAGFRPLDWHGYSFATPVKTITVQAPYQVVDGMQSADVKLNPLANISTRTDVQLGDKVLIGGFIITGTGQKKVLLRGLGPSLGAANIGAPLANPTLELHSGTGIIATNDDWKQTQMAAIEATGLAPQDDLESAIIATLDPGAYTAILSGQGNGTGVGLVEIYDLSPPSASMLGNISTRGFVGTGDNVMIGGLILRDAANVLLRALGPSLTNEGVANVLEDPQLEVHGPDGTVIAFNDDWRDTQSAEIEATGLPPTQDKESAILQFLPPGNYTAIVRGTGDTTGIALVEAYGL